MTIQNFGAAGLNTEIPTRREITSLPQLDWILKYPRREITSLLQLDWILKYPREITPYCSQKLLFSYNFNIIFRLKFLHNFVAILFASIISVCSMPYEKREGSGVGSGAGCRYGFKPLLKGSVSRRPKTCGSCSGSGSPTQIKTN